MVGVTNLLDSNLTIRSIQDGLKAAEQMGLSFADKTKMTVSIPGMQRIAKNEKIAQRLGVTGIDHKAYNEGLKEWKASREAGDEAAEQAAINKMNSSMANVQGQDPTKAVKAMFMNDQGEYSKARIGGAIAGSYMAANVVGNGSLGIPFISTASWNR